MPFSFRRNQRPYTINATQAKSEEIPMTSVEMLPSLRNSRIDHAPNPPARSVEISTKTI